MRRIRERRKLTTDRLVLVATDRSHAPALNAAANASLEELKPWMGWADDPPLEETLSFTLGAEERWERGTGWIFTILHDGVPVGTVGIDVFQPQLSSAQLGYWIRSDLAGQGLMKEAAKAVVDFAFEDLGLHRLELHASPHNVASVKVAESLGFRREGLARENARSATGYYDCAIFGLLESDPRPYAGGIQDGVRPRRAKP